MDLEKAAASASEAIVKKKSMLEELAFKRKELHDELTGNLDQDSQGEVEKMQQVIQELEVLRRNQRKMMKIRDKVTFLLL